MLLSSSIPYELVSVLYTNCIMGFWLLVCYTLFQVPNFKGKKKVMISIVPESVRKPIIIGLWKSPVYEAIKLIKDSSTEIYMDNVYHLLSL